jgi:hypothetical protein
MKPTTLVMGLTGMALAFAGGVVALPALVFLVAAAAGPVFVGGTLVGIVWLARPKGRPMQSAIPAGPLPRAWASAPANNIRPWGVIRALSCTDPATPVQWRCFAG